MWAPIFSQNKKNVLAALEAYISKLEYFKQVITDNDDTASYELMQKANDIRRVLRGIAKREKN